MKIVSIASTSLASISSRGMTYKNLLGSWTSLSKNPCSLNCASPICPLSRFVISSSFLTFIFFFSSSICFFNSINFLYSSSCFLFSAISWNYLVRFSGPLSFDVIELWEWALLFFRVASSIYADIFLPKDSECSTCSSFDTPNFCLRISSSALLPILWLLSLIVALPSMIFCFMISFISSLSYETNKSSKFITKPRIICFHFYLIASSSSSCLFCFSGEPFLPK